MKPTTFSPCSATMPMQLRCRRQRRKSSSVQAYSKLSCSVCRTSGMSRRIIQRICTRTCSFSVRFALIPAPLLSPRRERPLRGCAALPRFLRFTFRLNPADGVERSDGVASRVRRQRRRDLQRRRSVATAPLPLNSITPPFGLVTAEKAAYRLYSPNCCTQRICR